MKDDFYYAGSCELNIQKNSGKEVINGTHVALLLRKRPRRINEPKEYVKFYTDEYLLFKNSCSLQGRELELLFYLMGRTAYSSGELMDSNRTVAEKLNIGFANISRYMKTLVDAGAVLKIDKRKYLNPYLAYRGDWSKLDEKVKAVGEAQLNRWKEKALGSSVERDE